MDIEQSVKHGELEINLHAEQGLSPSAVKSKMKAYALLNDPVATELPSDPACDVEVLGMWRDADGELHDFEWGAFVEKVGRKWFHVNTEDGTVRVQPALGPVDGEQMVSTVRIRSAISGWQTAI